MSKNQLLGAIGYIAGQRQVAEVADEQATAWGQDTVGLLDGIVRVEPPPALTRAHKVEAGIVPAGSLGAALNKVSRQFAVDGSLACDLEQLGSDVEAGDLESTGGEAQKRASPCRCPDQGRAGPTRSIRDA